MRHGIRVVLFPGHHGPGTGATFGDYDEWTLNSDLVCVIGAHLVAKGFHVCPATGGGRRTYITHRAVYAGECEPDVAISVHFNSNEGSPGTGVEAWYLKPAAGTAEPTHSGKLATLLSGYVSKHLGVSDRGPKEYAPPEPGTEGKRIRILELMDEVCPMALLEVCFLNHPGDMALLLQKPFGLEDVALAMGHALDDWLRTRRGTAA